MCRDIPLKGGMEFDALTKWKNYCSFKAGTRQEIKKKFNRRERRIIRRLIKADLYNYIAESKE